MRRSFGGGGGRNMGGGGMIRTVQRALRTGVRGPTPEPLSGGAATIAANSRTAQNFNDKHTAITLSSYSSSGANNKNGTCAFSSLINFPLSSSSSSSLDESEWECVDGIEEGKEVVFYEDYNYNDDVFGSVPSTEEVHHAVSALHQAFGDKKVGAEMDWVEPSAGFCNSKMSHGPDKSVYNAFHLLETEPCVQRMVVSLSSDKAVWDAVLNNEVVKELRGSICDEADGLMEERTSNSDDPNPMKDDILSWIVANGKAKIMQLMDSIRKLVHQVFRRDGDGDADANANANVNADPFQEKLRTSFLLSVMVLIVVVITRTAKAA